MAKSREPWTIYTKVGWLNMKVDLQYRLVNPYLETDDAGGGGDDDNGLSVCSLCEKLTEFRKTKVLGGDNSVWT